MYGFLSVDLSSLFKTVYHTIAIYNRRLSNAETSNANTEMRHILLYKRSRSTVCTCL